MTEECCGTCRFSARKYVDEYFDDEDNLEVITELHCMRDTELGKYLGKPVDYNDTCENYLEEE